MPSQAPPLSPALLAAVIAGNAIEFYDFLAYSFFSVFIARAVFPGGDAYAGLFATIAVFGIGFVFRPLGSLVIGAYADRAGRRPAMLLTMWLMTAATLGLALTPPASAVGAAAPALLVLWRCLQGLAMGGEVGPTTAFLIEIAPAQRRGAIMGLAVASQYISSIVSGALGLGLAAALPDAALAAWGWRVPFLLAAGFIPILLRLRAGLPETHHAPAARAARPSLRPHLRPMLLATLGVCGFTVSAYVGNYMTTYAMTMLHLPAAASMVGTLGNGVGGITGALIGGVLADRFGRRAAALPSRLAIVALALPAFHLLSAYPSAAMLGAIAFVMSALSTAAAAAALLILPELLPRALRAGLFGVSYTAGVAIFGGLTQPLLTWLLHATGNPLVPAWYLAGASLVGAAAIAALPETRGRPLD